MFSTSTQKKYWIFSDEKDLTALRQKANAAYVDKYGSKMTPEERELYFLSDTEERMLLRFYELQLRDFCKRFSPPMPRATIATALHYFKRFYLRNSVMDYHPKEILVTCVYLATKVFYSVKFSQ
ncbi:hypothetical protein KQX54_003330 [Cotesia glomerata]|uniref:Cyclin N-terminal domain-containing protein n=1 Tax=Cotesia glomerata TaxID=32391 RepID=A0AAV7IMM5_COTGL|nr:hypothetical protein KQX54_003330 [Cotesia glomerata]